MQSNLIFCTNLPLNNWLQKIFVKKNRQKIPLIHNVFINNNNNKIVIST